jgi:diadenylate cyclase
MIRLGETRFLRPPRQTVTGIVDAVSEAVEFLSKSRFGALIAIERHVGLSGLAETGVSLNADVSARLIESIFWPNNPLHDLGVIIKGSRILAAGVQFPLAEEGVAPAELGSRHRAGLGLSTETDAIVVIVSEETGKISIAERGVLDIDIPRDQLRKTILKRMRATAPPEPVEEPHEEPADLSPPDEAPDEAPDEPQDSTREDADRAKEGRGGADLEEPDSTSRETVATRR